MKRRKKVAKPGKVMSELRAMPKKGPKGAAPKGAAKKALAVGLTEEKSAGGGLAKPPKAKKMATTGKPKAPTKSPDGARPGYRKRIESMDL